MRARAAHAWLPWNRPHPDTPVGPGVSGADPTAPPDVAAATGVLQLWPDSVIIVV